MSTLSNDRSLLAAITFFMSSVNRMTRDAGDEVVLSGPSARVTFIILAR